MDLKNQNLQFINNLQDYYDDDDKSQKQDQPSQDFEEETDEQNSNEEEKNQQNSNEQRDISTNYDNNTIFQFTHRLSSTEIDFINKLKKYNYYFDPVDNFQILMLDTQFMNQQIQQVYFENSQQILQEFINQFKWQYYPPNLYNKLPALNEFMVNDLGQINKQNLMNLHTQDPFTTEHFKQQYLINNLFLHGFEQCMNYQYRQCLSTYNCSICPCVIQLKHKSPQYQNLLLQKQTFAKNEREMYIRNVLLTIKKRVQSKRDTYSIQIKNQLQDYARNHLFCLNQISDLQQPVFKNRMDHKLNLLQDQDVQNIIRESTSNTIHDNWLQHLKGVKNVTNQIQLDLETQNYTFSQSKEPQQKNHHDLYYNTPFPLGILLVGEGGIGKSSTFRSLLSQKCNQRFWELGNNYGSDEFKYNTYNFQNIQLSDDLKEPFMRISNFTQTINEELFFTHLKGQIQANSSNNVQSCNIKNSQIQSQLSNNIMIKNDNFFEILFKQLHFQKTGNNQYVHTCHYQNAETVDLFIKNVIIPCTRRFLVWDINHLKNHTIQDICSEIVQIVNYNHQFAIPQDYANLLLSDIYSQPHLPLENKNPSTPIHYNPNPQLIRSPTQKDFNLMLDTIEILWGNLNHQQLTLTNHKHQTLQIRHSHKISTCHEDLYRFIHLKFIHMTTKQKNTWFKIFMILNQIFILDWKLQCHHIQILNIQIKNPTQLTNQINFLYYSLNQLYSQTDTQQTDNPLHINFTMVKQYLNQQQYKPQSIYKPSDFSNFNQFFIQNQEGLFNPLHYYYHNIYQIQNYDFLSQGGLIKITSHSSKDQTLQFNNNNHLYINSPKLDNYENY